MTVLWRLEKAFVKEIIAEMPEPKPHYNTVSTIISILSKKKGFVGYESFGNTHRYYPLVSKETYQKRDLGEVMQKYFDNSWQKMVTYFAKEEQVTNEELDEIIKMIKNNKS